MRTIRNIVLFGSVATAWCLPLKPISSAEVCGRCHRSIVEAWKESSHARAADGRLFQDALAAAEEKMGTTVRQTCLGCHAPIAVHTNDLQLDRKASWEGVTCDYCHSVRDVTLAAGVNPKAKVDFGTVKSGPLKNSVSGAHGTAYSAVHVSSAVCAPCHEYRNNAGFPILTTFSEWQASRYAKENRTCQSCHMYSVAGKVAEARLSREPDARVNLHRMPGSRSVSQLNQTLRTRMTSTRQGDEVKVTVQVTNSGAGHYVPTGSPLRQLILQVQASSKGLRLSQNRVYARRVADASGSPVAQEHSAFLKAVMPISDTRLAPDETRTEQFIFAIPQGAKTEVRATLSYYYSPSARDEADRLVTIRSIRDEVR